jgi:hypothetical protein
VCMGSGKTMRDVTFRPLSLPACLVCTLDTSSSVQSFPEPNPMISNESTAIGEDMWVIRSLFGGRAAGLC